MYLFLMICLAVVAIAVVAWLYLFLGRKALDGSVRPDNEIAGKPLVRMPGGRRAAGKAEDYPLPGGAPSASGHAVVTGKDDTDGEITAPGPAATETAPAPPAAAGTGSVGSRAAKASDTASTTGTTGEASGATAETRPDGGEKTPGAPAAKSGKAGAAGKRPKAKTGAKSASASKDAKEAKRPAASAGSPPTKPAPEEPLFTAPAGAKDKLTDIKGIGPVAERQLNEQGITTFRQIADLSAADIQRIDDYMPFSDRQIRDWQAQAKSRV